MNHWRALHDRFMVLMAEENQIIQQHAPRFCLCAIGTLDSTTKYGRWEFSHQTNDNFQHRVMLACLDAGRWGGCPNFAHPLDVWLHRLLLFFSVSREAAHVVAMDVDLCRIDNLCEASATLCAHSRI